VGADRSHARQGIERSRSVSNSLYEKNGAALVERLGKVHQWCKDTIAELAEEKRILVTSHDAYNYFGRAYGLKVIGLQGVSTVSEAALADMANLVDFIKKQNVKPSLSKRASTQLRSSVRPKMPA
jgi:manganese/zinc/iron transport system substrate-binding protein